MKTAVRVGGRLLVVGVLLAGCSGLWVVFNFLARTPEAGVR